MRVTLTVVDPESLRYLRLKVLTDGMSSMKWHSFFAILLKPFTSICRLDYVANDLEVT